MGGAPDLSRKRINSLISTRAKSLAPVATRAIASGDPLAILVLTARPSELNRPRADATTKGAALASIGRSKENWIAIGGRTSFAAWPSSAPRHANPSRPVSKPKKRRNVIDGLARIENTSGPGRIWRAGQFG